MEGVQRWRRAGSLPASALGKNSRITGTRRTLVTEDSKSVCLLCIVIILRPMLQPCDMTESLEHLSWVAVSFVSVLPSSCTYISLGALAKVITLLCELFTWLSLRFIPRIFARVGPCCVHSGSLWVSTMTNTQQIHKRYLINKWTYNNNWYLFSICCVLVMVISV